MNTLILLVFAAMTAVEQAAPISSNTTTHTTSAQKTIDALKEEVKNGVTSVYQDILTLESNNGETYDSPYQGCYVRFEPNNNVDVNTLKDDVKSFNQLLPVIKDLANNETNETTVDYYRKIMYSMNISIVALNNLIAALENNDEEELYTDSAESPTQANQTDPSTDDKMDANSESETDHCEQLDKSSKLHALKVQAQLTYQDILLLPTKDQTT